MLVALCAKLSVTGANIRLVGHRYVCLLQNSNGTNTTFSGRNGLGIYWTNWLLSNWKQLNPSKLKCPIDLIGNTITILAKTWNSEKRENTQKFQSSNKEKTYFCLFSLGAHVMGNAGRMFKELRGNDEISRLTALGSCWSEIRWRSNVASNSQFKWT